MCLFDMIPNVEYFWKYNKKYFIKYFLSELKQAQRSSYNDVYIN